MLLSVAGLSGHTTAGLLPLLQLSTAAEVSSSMLCLAEKQSLISSLPLPGFCCVLCNGARLCIAFVACFLFGAVLLPGASVVLTCAGLAMVGAQHPAGVDTERSRACLSHQPETLPCTAPFHSTCYGSLSFLLRFPLSSVANKNTWLQWEQTSTQQDTATLQPGSPLPCIYLHVLS